MYDKTVRRRRAVLGLLVVSSLILLTAYFGERSGGALHNVQRGILEVVSPIQEGASRALKPVRDLFGWVGDTVSAKGDLKDTRADRDQWRATAIRNQAAVRENDQLRGLLALDKQPKSLQPYGPVTARTIGSSPTLWYVKITIDKGTSSGIHEDMPVIASDGRSDSSNGLIGKVESATGNASVVRLITDSTMAVSARTALGNATGLVQPSPGDPRDLIMRYVDKNEPIAKGNVVVTAGTASQRSELASVYPPDLPIGRVTRVDNPSASNQLPHLRPFVDLRRVQYVQVLTKPVNNNR
ncbi:MAG TPA: rod shape-determining protein MreC [Baekduia sp.]|uniref:rod shape-determining protein MreC n=1 Tax=Baekduia sp. TaxID=2600305 RepID=UPI002C121E2B|nr:rod shape-determining protein MreC [Baekduia sp.]HMJ32498.1 rod shape-determining protein MreC [Baekduia sp.]